MTFYAGFDAGDFPGLATMQWLKQNSNLYWCGYYLAPAPNYSGAHDQWAGHFLALRGSGWGVAPIYVGQQVPGKKTASTLTTAQGQVDGAQAVANAHNDGIPANSYLYLDWEDGSADLADDAADYVTAWINQVVALGYRPGIYCSHVAANAFSALLDAITPTPQARLWCWKVSTTDTHDYAGQLSGVPALNPAGCGFTGATMWQRDQNTWVKATGLPAGKIYVDFSTSSVSDPST